MYSNVTFKFDGKRALVTGGAQGIGHGIALALSNAGAETYVLDINKEGLDQLASEHPSIHTICVNLCDWSATRQAVEQITPIDLVVNGAAILIEESFVDIEPQSFDDSISVNTKAPLNICQIIVKDLIARKKSGAIVNISSSGSKIPVPGCPMYSLTKAAMDMITKSLAAEVGHYKIRVNSVLPSLVRTELGKRVWGNEVASKSLTDSIPVGRFAEIADIVGPVLFLLSDCADMIHGHQLVVGDGGHSMG